MVFAKTFQHLHGLAVFCLAYDSENTKRYYCGQSISKAIEKYADDTIIGHGQNSHQHIASVAYRRKGHHPLEALLNKCHHIADYEGEHSTDGQYVVPKWLHIRIGYLQQAHDGSKASSFHYGAHEHSEEGGGTLIYIGCPEMEGRSRNLE